MSGAVSHLGPLRRETTKLLALKRTYIGGGLILLIPVVMAVAMKLSADPHHGDGEGAPVFMRFATESGLYTPLASLMMAVFIVLPLAAAMVGGFMVAGEAELGTLRTILVRPVRRGGVLLAKWTVGAAYLAILLALMTLVGLAIGGALFGVHPILTAANVEGGIFQMRLVEIPVGQAMLLIAGANLVAWVYLVAIMSLAMMVSTMGDSSLVATIVTIVALLVVQAVLQFSYFADVRPYWLWTYFMAWFGVLEKPTDWGEIWRALAVSASYSAVAAVVAWAVFRRKDVLS